MMKYLVLGVDGMSNAVVFLGEFDSKKDAEKRAEEYKKSRGRAFVIKVGEDEDVKEKVVKKGRRGKKKIEEVDEE